MYADDLVDLFGVDAIRYYVLHEMPFANDGTITYDLIIDRVNSDLANILGNLVNRTISMVHKYFDGTVCNKHVQEENDFEFISEIRTLDQRISEKMDRLEVGDALEDIINLLRRSNKYIDETMPWALGKDESKRDRLAAVLYNLCESLRIVSILLTPFMPETAPKIQAQIGAPAETLTYDAAGTWGLLPADAEIVKGDTLFPRIDVDKEIEELNALIVTKPAAPEKKKIEGLAQIGIDDFSKVELRVAEIVKCEPIKRAKKLLKLTLNDGEGERTVASGIAKWYKPEDLVGRHIILVANLKPAVLCGVESQGMILAADAGEDDVKVIFVDDVPAGSSVH